MDESKVLPIMDPQSEEQYVVRTKSSSLIPIRYVLVVLLFLGNMNIYGMRVNLSIALVAMVNDSETGSHQQVSYCKGVQNDTHRTDTAGEFNWNANTQGLILGAFYYGYLFSNVPGGYFSVYLSAKWTLGLSVLFSAVINLLTPLAAYHGYVTLIASRVILGLVQGLYFPSFYHLQGLWMPPDERSRSFSVTSSGTAVGSLLYLFVPGYLASSNIMGGWPSVFYISGFTGILFCILWFLLAYDSPSVHPWISNSEKLYIMNSLKWEGSKKQKVPRVPLCSILKSPPVWAIVICQTCMEFVMFLFLAETPKYFSSIQGFNLSQSGSIAGLPHLAQCILGIFIGFAADGVISRNLLRVVTVRKGLTAIGVTAQCVLFLMTAYSGCNSTMAVVCFLVAMSFGGVYVTGYYVNKLDVAPNSVSVIAGITNFMTTIGGMIGPPLVALITKEHGTIQEWQVLFWMICGVLLLGGLVFTLFASGEQQAWDRELSETVPQEGMATDINDDHDSETPLLRE